MATTIRLRSTVWFATGAVVALIASLMVLDAVRADAAPGDSDTTFVGITACRLADTRPPPDRAGTKSTFGPVDTHAFQATGTNGNCTIPADAAGLSMNVTALNATARGFLTFWPSGPLPLASSLNPSPGEPPIPNAVTTSLSSTGSFNAFNKNGSVDMVIDVVGYYVKTSLVDISTRLLELETKVSPLETSVASLEAKVSVLVNSVAATASGEQNLTLTTADQTVRSVSLMPPADGTVIVNSSADVDQSGAAVLGARCSITTGAATESDHFQISHVALNQQQTIGGTRGFSVLSGVLFTVNLVCERFTGDGSIRDSALAAIFAPT